MAPTRPVINPLQQYLTALALLFVIIGCSVAACSAVPGVAHLPVTNPQAAQKTAPQNIVLGLSLPNLTNPYYLSIKTGAEESADRLGINLIVQDAKGDPASQVLQIRDMVDQKINALLVTPIDPELIMPAIKGANDNGIPVITVDRSSPRGTIVTHIASDNVLGAKIAGDYLAQALKKKGNVVELRGEPGNISTIDRSRGFDEALKAYPNIRVVGREFGNNSRQQAKTAFASLLASNPQINGVFAHNDEMILGALEAAKDAGRADQIVFVGYDGINEVINALDAGDIAATIVLQPLEMGRLGVENAYKMLQGQKIPASIPVDLSLVTR